MTDLRIQLIESFNSGLDTAKVYIMLDLVALSNKFFMLKWLQICFLGESVCR